MKYAYDYTPKNSSCLSRNICENSFSKWSNTNMYRTSYTNTFTPVRIMVDPIILLETIVAEK